MKEKIVEFLTDVSSKISKETAEEFAEVISREFFLISVILLVFATIGSVIGTIIVETIQVLSSVEVPFYLLGLIPWITSTIGVIICGYALYHWRGPRVRAICKRFFK